MKPSRQMDWLRLKSLALGLGLPNVVEATTWGEPCLKAHGKLWVWWSPSEDAPVFKVPLVEREILLAAEPETFFVTDHYRGHPLVLVRPERVDADWARATLLRVWRAMAPKRVLKAFDATRSAMPASLDAAAEAEGRPRRQSSRNVIATTPAPGRRPRSAANAKKPRPSGRGS